MFTIITGDYCSILCLLSPNLPDNPETGLSASLPLCLSSTSSPPLSVSGVCAAAAWFSEDVR